MCRVYPEREIEILETWCRLATGHPWAWHEARSRLEGLVVREEEVPHPLARFAIERPPPSTRGPDPEGSRNVVIECMVRRLQAEGFDPHDVNSQFGESFPSPGRKDPGSTVRKRRAKARPFVAPVFETHEDDEGDPQEFRRKVVLEYDWSEPVDATVVLLTSGWPAFALIWELWPEHREEHIAAVVRSGEERVVGLGRAPCPFRSCCVLRVVLSPASEGLRCAPASGESLQSPCEARAVDPRRCH